MSAEFETEAADPHPLNDLHRAAGEARALQDEISAIVGEVREQIRGEFALARTSLGEGAAVAGAGAAWATVAVVAAVLTLGFAGLAAVAALYLVMPLWAASLIVTAAYLLITAAAALGARARLAALVAIPKRSLHSIREDVLWAQRQFSSNTN